MPPFDKEETGKRIDDLLRKIRSEADPVTLNTYRSLIRRRVPFFMRTYLAAYLLMREEHQDGSKVPYKKEKSNHSDATFKVDEPKHSIPEEEAQHLFIGVGRNRRIFPRELLSLILTETSVSKEDIGNIRILDNYSFVQVRKTVADEIIEALNGKPYRGRPLTVNYARLRKEEDIELAKEGESEPVEKDDSL
jgi:hypothetical protein